MPISICTFNVKGLGETKKRNHIFNWLRNNNHDIFFLQEVHCKTSEYKKWKLEWGSDAYFNGNSSNSAGTCILLKKNNNFKIIEHKEIITGRLQCLNIEIEERNIMLINIYGPNTDDGEFFLIF